MTMAEVFQLIGGMFLTFAALPQITQILITRSVQGLNLLTFLMILTGNAMKMVYAIYMAINGYGLVLTITTGMSFAIILTLTALIIYYRYFRKVRKFKRWREY